jgi:hypothetical protein
MSGTAVHCCFSRHHQSVDAVVLEEEVLMLALLYKKFSKKKHCHQNWVHPVLCTRLEMGQFYTLFYKLRKDESEFFKYFCMSLKSFDELLYLL